MSPLQRHPPTFAADHLRPLKKTASRFRLTSNAWHAQQMRTPTKHVLRLWALGALLRAARARPLRLRCSPWCSRWCWRCPRHNRTTLRRSLPFPLPSCPFPFFCPFGNAKAPAHCAILQTVTLLHCSRKPRPNVGGRPLTQEATCRPSKPTRHKERSQVATLSQAVALEHMASQP